MPSASSSTTTAISRWTRRSTTAPVHERWGFGSLSFYPTSTSRFAFLKRIVPFVFSQGGEDRVQGGSDFLTVPGIRLHMSRQGFFRADYLGGPRAVAGQRFKRGRVRAFGNAQVFKWLRAGGNVNSGYATYYDESIPSRAGRPACRRSGPPAERAAVGRSRVDPHRLQPRRHARRRLRPDDPQLEDDLPVLAPPVRAADRAARHSEHRVLLDALGSYELRPGTVFFAGYGALRQRRTFTDGEWQVDAAGPMRATRRGLFLKASYLTGSSVWESRSDARRGHAHAPAQPSRDGHDSPCACSPFAAAIAPPAAPPMRIRSCKRVRGASAASACRTAAPRSAASLRRATGRRAALAAAGAAGRVVRRAGRERVQRGVRAAAARRLEPDRTRRTAARIAST
jgi:hypothetical protein